MKMRIVMFLVVAVVAIGASWADTETVNGVEWNYTVSDGKSMIFKSGGWSAAIPTSTTGAITIPATLGGYPVTSIGGWAFYRCSFLTSVTIPDSVTSIGDLAFEDCSGLTSVIIPDSVTSLGGWAFSGCSRLASVTIGNGVTSIGEYAFLDCSALTSVLIPDNVTSIEYDVFCGCSSLTSVTIGNGLTSIALGAFEDCSELTSVTIGNSVTSIGEYAFLGCSALTNMTIPDNVMSIGSYAFEGCSGLTSVTIGNGMTSIGVLAFMGCSGLTSVAIPDSVTSIGVRAFPGIALEVSDGNPNYMSISGLLLTKDGRTLVAGINGDVTIPDSVISIGSSAFSGCSGLTSVTIPDSVTSIGDEAFWGCSGLAGVVIPAGVASIARAAFSGCISLTSVIIPDGLTSIGDLAFEDCSGLTSVTIPDSVTSIGSSAFAGCSGLMSFVVADGNPAYKSVSGLLLTKDGQTLVAGVNGDVTIPDGVTSIRYNVFSGCVSLTSVMIPGSVTNIGSSAFAGCCGLMSFVVADGNSVYKSVSGLLLTKDGQTLVAGVNGDVTIPDGVTSIGYAAFSGYRGLTSVTISDSVTNIGPSAFSGCSSLASVAIGNGVMDIVDDVFSGCGALMSFSVADGNANYSSSNGLLLSKDGHMLLRGVNGDVYIPDSVTSIGEYAFDGCSGLTSVTIPDSVTSIGYGAFFGCSWLTSVVIPDSVTIIDYEAFSHCSRLANVTIPNSVKRIESEAFYETALATVYITPGDTERVKALIEDSGQDMRGITFVEVMQPVPTPDPTSGTEEEHELYAEVEGAAPATAASEYNGYLYDAGGVVNGTILIKVGKPGKDGKVTFKAIVQVGASKATLKAADNGKATLTKDGPTTIQLVGGEACTITLGEEGMSGSYGAYTIDGSRNFFSSKDKSEQGAANDLLTKWLGPVNVVWDGGSASVSIAKKGKAKVSVTLANGTKATANAQVLVGEKMLCVPVVVTKKANLAFALWLPLGDGRAIVEGLGDGAIAGRPGTLAANAAFHVSKTAALWSSIAGTVLADYIPDGVRVSSSGGKWVLPKAGKVVYKDGAVDKSKLGENPSALKLTYKAKDGSFKGSFKVYAVDGGKAKATTVNVTGVMVNGVGYGTATIKGKGSVAVTVK